LIFLAILTPKILKKRNARTSSGVLLVFSYNGIDVITKLHLCPFGWHRCNFLIKKITSMPFQENTKRTQEDALAFLIKKRRSKKRDQNP
jgi:hypothetical protein